METIVQTCADFALPIFEEAASVENIMNKPLRADHFSPDFLQFRWEPLISNAVKDANMDAFIDLVLKRIVSDSLVAESEIENQQLESNYTENSTRISAGIMEHRLKLCASVLDFCFHSRRNKKTADMWCVSFFGLFSAVTDMLAWPCALLEFWSYPESRIEWFKMGNSLDSLPLGVTNLTSYKQPLFDKLRHWNDILNNVQNNSYLNTPLHYKMKFKLEKFVSELLPIYEESNFNRSALISNRQSSGNYWNKTISSATRTDESSENIFATDYNYIFDNMLTCPLEFLYRPLDFKVDIDKLLTLLLDAIFEIEEEFYKNLNISHRKLSDINEKLNPGFPINFKTVPDKAPRYMRISEKINDERAHYWNEFMELDQSASLMVQPTLLDISLSNPGTLYQQMMKLDNDYYRKQFLIQLYFSAGLIRSILTSKEVENYYKSCYQKEKPSKNISFANLTDANYKKTLALCNHIIENRITKFFSSRDFQFLSTIQKLFASDNDLLKSKIDGFKQFQRFKNSHDSLKKIFVDESFKKFGFIKLGNKAISNIWKIKSGLELIDKKPLTSGDYYDMLREKWITSCNNTEEVEQDDKMVKQWQNLRSIRPRYLFSFRDVDESVGIAGLFDSTLIRERAKSKDNMLEKLNAKLNSAHRDKLKEARNYMQKRNIRKRSLEEKLEGTSNKKLHLGNQTDEDPCANEISDVIPTRNATLVEKQENNQTENSDKTETKSSTGANSDAILLPQANMVDEDLYPKKSALDEDDIEKEDDAQNVTRNEEITESDNQGHHDENSTPPEADGLNGDVGKQDAGASAQHGIIDASPQNENLHQPQESVSKGSEIIEKAKNFNMSREAPDLCERESNE